MKHDQHDSFASIVDKGSRCHSRAETHSHRQACGLLIKYVRNRDRGKLIT